MPNRVSQFGLWLKGRDSNVPNWITLIKTISILAGIIIGLFQISFIASQSQEVTRQTEIQTTLLELEFTPFITVEKFNVLSLDHKKSRIQFAFDIKNASRIPVYVEVIENSPNMILQSERVLFGAGSVHTLLFEAPVNDVEHDNFTIENLVLRAYSPLKNDLNNLFVFSGACEFEDKNFNKAPSCRIGTFSLLGIE